MLSKCANPSCSTALVYLREGKIFMMEHSQQPQVRPEGPVLVKPQSLHHVEHFWLCGPCSTEMTLICDGGVKVMPKVKRLARAVAS